MADVTMTQLVSVNDEQVAEPDGDERDIEPDCC